MGLSSGAFVFLNDQSCAASQSMNQSSYPAPTHIPNPHSILTHMTCTTLSELAKNSHV